MTDRALTERALTDVVLDASIVLAWALPDERAASLDAFMTTLDERTVHVPAHFPEEVTNALVQAVRRGRLAEALAVALSDRLEALPTQLTAAGQDPGTVLALALKHELTAYDAAYLSAAMTLGAELATGDARLRRAAQVTGVRLV